MCKALVRAIARSRFTAEFELHNGKSIHVKTVRLKTAKPYCGQHPGACLRDRPKRKMCLLEWDDWVEFNGRINDALDAIGVNADVFSTPAETVDVGRKMFIRRGVRRRIHWDWSEEPNRYGAIVRVWNHGSEDQFTA